MSENELKIPSGYKGKITLERKNYAYRTDAIDPLTDRPLALDIDKPMAFIPKSWGKSEMRDLRVAELAGMIKIELSDSQEQEWLASENPRYVRGFVPQTNTNERIRGDIEGTGRILEKLPEVEKQIAISISSTAPGEMPEPQMPEVPQDWWKKDTLPDNNESFKNRYNGDIPPAQPENWRQAKLLDTTPDKILESNTGRWDLGPIREPVVESEQEIAEDPQDTPIVEKKRGRPKKATE